MAAKHARCPRSSLSRIVSKALTASSLTTGFIPGLGGRIKLHDWRLHSAEAASLNTGIPKCNLEVVIYGGEIRSRPDTGYLEGRRNRSEGEKRKDSGLKPGLHSITSQGWQGGGDHEANTSASS